LNSKNTTIQNDEILGRRTDDEDLDDDEDVVGAFLKNMNASENSAPVPGMPGIRIIINKNMIQTLGKQIE